MPLRRTAAALRPPPIPPQQPKPRTPVGHRGRSVELQASLLLISLGPDNLKSRAAALLAAQAHAPDPAGC
jgi:hypothetical protein